VCKPSKTTIKRWHCFGDEKESKKQQSKVNNQNTKDDLKIFLRILSTLPLNISSLIHLCDQGFYVWTTVDTIPLCSATNSCVIRRSSYSIGRSTLNPHLRSGFSFLSSREYQLPGIEISEYQRTSIRGVGRRVAFRRNSPTYLYVSDGNWRRFDFGRSWTSVSRG
jgi:hypothetical protein